MSLILRAFVWYSRQSLLGPTRQQRPEVSWPIDIEKLIRSSALLCGTQHTIRFKPTRQKRPCCIVCGLLAILHHSATHESVADSVIGLIAQLLQTILLLHSFTPHLLQLINAGFLSFVNR